MLNASSKIGDGHFFEDSISPLKVSELLNDSRPQEKLKGFPFFLFLFFSSSSSSLSSMCFLTTLQV